LAVFFCIQILLRLLMYAEKRTYMLQLINFDKAPIAKSTFYGGNAGAKEAIIYNNGVWMIKYPKTTRDLNNPQISYTTSPLSE